jgi:hypothetical protein
VGDRERGRERDDGEGGGGDSNMKVCLAKACMTWSSPSCPTRWNSSPLPVVSRCVTFTTDTDVMESDPGMDVIQNVNGRPVRIRVQVKVRV